MAERYPAWAAAGAAADYLAIHGSAAFGLATEESDLDLKGSSIRGGTTCSATATCPPSSWSSRPRRPHPVACLDP